MARFRQWPFRLVVPVLMLPLAALTAGDLATRANSAGRSRGAGLQTEVFTPAAEVSTPSTAVSTRSTARRPRIVGGAREASLDQYQSFFIRPGVTVKIVSAGIAQDGTITARVNIADPKGLPLDRDGVYTPGAVSMSFIAAYIPANRTQYVSYTTTTAKATLNTNPSQIQAANDSGGSFTKNNIGDYTYTFKTKAPAGFDASATHAIGVSVNRNLTEFITYDEFTEVANDVFNFVPNGAPVTVVRSVVGTDACNNCHNPLIGHGGSRLKVELCILCHTPQTVNPDTALTQDMRVLIHKIHMGSSLPSVNPTFALRGLSGT